MRRIVEKLGDKIALYGLITGPFTMALHLRGTDLFFDLIEDEESATKLMDFCRDVCKATADLYMEQGVDIIAVVDPVVSQISPANFAQFVAPAATAIFDHIRAKGKAGSFFVCGNAKRNIEEMCKCHPDNISIDENIPLGFVKDVAEQYGVSVGGNIQLTVTMLFGTPADNIKDARNCMAIGGSKGYILSPGCDMPFATPVENVQAIASLVYGEDAEYISTHSVLDGIEVTIPDYAAEKTVFIDVITLDSASCAPCQYMMEAVYAASAGLENKLTIIEHKVKEKEAVVFMIKMGVKNIPTIVIDGEVKFISLIPEVPELKKQIQAALKKKGM
jgi:uroporphyrinogen decarboxylase